MRPEKAHALVRKAIQSYLKNKSTKQLYAVDTVRAIQILDKGLRRDWKKYEGEYGPYDDRCPKELTGYSSVFDEMFYISDRFMAPHRINWLLCGVTEKLFPETMTIPKDLVWVGGAGPIEEIIEFEGKF